MGSSGQILQSDWDSAQADHLVLGPFAVIGPDVDRLDRVRQQTDGIAEGEGILDGVQHAIVGRQPADEEPSDIKGLKVAVEGRSLKAGVGVVVRIDAFVNDYG